MFIRQAIIPALAVACWLVLGVLVWGHPNHAAPDGEPSVPRAKTNAIGETTSAAKPSRGLVLVGSLTVFVLAIFVGFEVINKVPPTLHTPLMSGSNAISGITVVGSILAAGTRHFGFATLLGVIAVALANINVVGGFLVTHRMLMMFKKR